MQQFILRQVPILIEKQLREKSRKNGVSLNKMIISLLKKALGLPDGYTKKRSASHLAGTWNSKQANQLTHHLKIFEKIDKDVWKK
jgi:hypothetical protein